MNDRTLQITEEPEAFPRGEALPILRVFIIPVHHVQPVPQASGRLEVLLFYRAGKIIPNRLPLQEQPSVSVKPSRDGSPMHRIGAIQSEYTGYSLTEFFITTCAPGGTIQHKLSLCRSTPGASYVRADPTPVPREETVKEIRRRKMVGPIPAYPEFARLIGRDLDLPPPPALNPDYPDPLFSLRHRR